MFRTRMSYRYSNIALSCSAAGMLVFYPHYSSARVQSAGAHAMPKAIGATDGGGNFARGKVREVPSLCKDWEMENFIVEFCLRGIL